MPRTISYVCFGGARSGTIFVMSQRIFSKRAADERFASVARVCAEIRGGIDAVCSYSVKTNPHELMLAGARRHGFLAEVISDDEASWAERCGFAPRSLIYNGPRPPLLRREAIGIVFADSIEAFERDVAIDLAELIGIRLRPAMLRTSRFGIPVEEDDALAERLRERRAPIGISMHARRGDYAGATWRDLCEDLLRRGARLQRETGCPIVAFDVGGGWEPATFDREFAADARWLVPRLAAVLPAVERLIIEPGQAIATPVESIATTVLEVRRRPGRIEAVVDLGHGDWPSQHEYAHEFAYARGDADWETIGSGGDRLSGSTCLEYDYIDGLRFPSGIAPGDRILVRNTGSYDRSMAFPFAHGVLSDSLAEVSV
jgi:diaminopimelate decarboxylase